MSPTSDDPAAIGARIRTLRQQRGMSQTDLAKPTYSASYLSRIESGDRPAGAQMLADLAQRLGTTVDHLQTGRDPEASGTLDLEIRFAELALRTGEAEDAVNRFAAAVTRAGSTHPEARLRAQLGVAQANEAMGDLDAALSAFHETADSVVVGSKSWVDSTLGLIRCYRQVGDLDKSIASGEQAVGLLRDRSDWPTPDSIRVLSTLQASYQIRGDLHYAMHLASEAVTLAEGLSDPRAIASALWNTSLLNAELGAVSDAVAMAERALTLLSELDAERDTVRLRVALARLYTLDSRGAEALEMLNRLETRLRELGVSSDLAYWRHERARALFQLGELDEAEREAQAALEVLGPEPRLTVADVYLTLGRIAKHRGSDEATEWLKRSAEQLLGVGLMRAAAKTWTELGEELDELQDLAGARNAYRAAAACSGLVGPRTMEVAVAQLMAPASPDSGRRKTPHKP